MDDLTIAATEHDMINTFKKSMVCIDDLEDLEDLHFILGLEVT